MNVPQDKRAVIYCRVSTKEQVDEGNSLTTQEKHCMDYAQRQGFLVVEKFIEQGESAKTADRTQLQRLLNFCADKRNGVQVIIAYKLDRISRNTDDYSQIRLLLKRYGVEFRFTSEHFEDTPSGRFLENMMANVAQFDNDIRTERSINGMKEAMREGRYVWQASYGYSNVRLAGKATICPNEKAPLVRKLFEAIAGNTQPLEVIRNQLIREGLCDGRGRPLSRTHFYVLIRNPVYAGWIVKFGEKHKGTFEPIVSEELFEQVQRVLQAKTNPNRQYQVAHTDFPLRRFVFGPSGRKLTGSWSTSHTGQKYPYYILRNPTRCIRKEVLEKAFLRLLRQHCLDEKHFSQLKHFVREKVDKALARDIRQRNQLAQHIQVLEEKQAALIDKNIKGVINDKVLQQQLLLVDKELLETHAQLYRLPEAPINYQMALDYVKEFFVRPDRVWLDAKLEDKIRLQWFYFPEGLQVREYKSKTGDISFHYNAETLFWSALSAKVTLRNRISNRQKPLKSLSTQRQIYPHDHTTSSRRLRRGRDQIDDKKIKRLAYTIESVTKLKQQMENANSP